MAQRSKIDKLPPEVRAELDRLLADKNNRLEDVVEGLKALGVRLSRSGVGRYSLKIEAIGERMRRSREIADALALRTSGVPNDHVRKMLIETLHSVVLDIMSATDEDGEPVELSAKQAYELGRALKELATTEKLDAERIAKIKREAAEATINATNEKLKAAKQPGLSQDVVAQIRHAVLGTGA